MVENQNGDVVNDKQESSSATDSASSSATTTPVKQPINERDLNNIFDNNDFMNILEKTTKLKHDLVNDILLKSDKFKEDLQNLLLVKQVPFHRTEKDANNNDKLDAKKEVPGEKTFQYRESLLTELFKISHIRTLRHIFISILIILLFQIVIFDLHTKGSVDLDFDLLRWCFKDFTYTMMWVWIPMKLATMFLVYYGLFAWAFLRRFTDKSTEKIYDYVFLTIYIVYQLTFIVLPLENVAKISVACKLIILLEQVRLLMKSHAFVRHNIPRIRNVIKKESDNDSDDEKETKRHKRNATCPRFSKYFYFLFAPTLVYRDEYPRTVQIRWLLVITYFAEVLGSIVYTYCLFDRFCVPLFRNLAVKELTFKSYVYLISICIMPGALCQFMTFFALLHSWHNAWAEMLRFGDRQFYLDWWNSTSYNKYYRTWNTLVQDWLHTYIYRDLYLLLGSRYRALSQFGVIFISSVFHEHILSFAFGFFYPIMFVLFSGFGFICLFIPRGKSAIWNVFIWTSLFTGLGIQICLFSIEWYARNTAQCPRKIDSILDYMIPRSILCY